LKCLPGGGAMDGRRLGMKFESPVKMINLTGGSGKTWVQVEFEDGTVWKPRLWEVGAIVSGIGKAEDKKYPDGMGHRMTKRFLDQCWGLTREQIYDLSLSTEFDPNGVMQSRYRKHRCPSCGRWHDGENETCGTCQAANKAWGS